MAIDVIEGDSQELFIAEPSQCVKQFLIVGSIVQQFGQLIGEVFQGLYILGVAPRYKGVEDFRVLDKVA